MKNKFQIYQHEINFLKLFNINFKDGNFIYLDNNEKFHFISLENDNQIEIYRFKDSNDTIIEFHRENNIPSFNSIIIKENGIGYSAGENFHGNKNKIGIRINILLNDSTMFALRINSDILNNSINDISEVDIIQFEGNKATQLCEIKSTLTSIYVDSKYGINLECEEVNSENYVNFIVEILKQLFKDNEYVLQGFFKIIPYLEKGIEFICEIPIKYQDILIEKIEKRKKEIIEKCDNQIQSAIKTAIYERNEKLSDLDQYSDILKSISSSNAINRASKR